eukprot:7951441-Lingulodinium_polyedra.AAC.1
MARRPRSSQAQQTELAPCTLRAGCPQTARPPSHRGARALRNRAAGGLVASRPSYMKDMLTLKAWRGTT